MSSATGKRRAEDAATMQDTTNCGEKEAVTKRGRTATPGEEQTTLSKGLDLVESLVHLLGEADPAQAVAELGTADACAAAENRFKRAAELLQKFHTAAARRKACLSGRIEELVAVGKAKWDAGMGATEEDVSTFVLQMELLVGPAGVKVNVEYTFEQDVSEYIALKLLVATGSTAGCQRLPLIDYEGELADFPGDMNIHLRPMLQLLQSSGIKSWNSPTAEQLVVVPPPDVHEVEQCMQLEADTDGQQSAAPPWLTAFSADLLHLIMTRAAAEGRKCELRCVCRLDAFTDKLPTGKALLDFVRDQETWFDNAPPSPKTGKSGEGSEDEEAEAGEEEEQEDAGDLH